MSETPDDHQDPVGDEVAWYRDPDGTEWFVEDGVRFELADDGFAYPVVGGTTDPAGAERLELIFDEEAGADDADDADGEDADDTADTEDAEDAEDAAAQDSPFAPDVTTRITTIKVDEPDPAEASNAVDGKESGKAAWPAPGAASSAPAGNGLATGEPLLDVRGLDAGYGSLPVLKGVDLQVRAGETAVLLGLNGAGKTTTVANICGALSPWGGEIRFDGQDVSGWSTSKAVASGVVMVPEGRRVFPDLSVGRNLQVGAWNKRGDNDWIDAQRDQVFEYFPRLRERVDQMAGTLSGGEQQMLAIGRGLMAGPRLLIIDEASMGLAPVIVQDVFDIVGQINQDGVTVLMVEQNVGVLEVADIGYVMEQGRVVRILEGEELEDRNLVSEALMG